MNELIKFTQEREMIVFLPRELDHHSAASVRAEIDSALFSKEPKALVFDLSGVEFMDSSGLGLVLGRYARASVLGIPIIIRNPTPRQERLFIMAQMHKMVKIEKEAKNDEKAAK